MEVPGNLGYGILGDKSIELVRSPLNFIAQRRTTYGDVFQARILNKPHIFITSNKAVADLLQGENLGQPRFFILWFLYIQPRE